MSGFDLEAELLQSAMDPDSDYIINNNGAGGDDPTAIPHRFFGPRNPPNNPFSSVL